MKITDILGMALKNMFRRKMRTFLTLLGVLIGTTSIAVMMSIGVGLDRTMEEQMQRYGSLNTITVDPYTFYESEGAYVSQPSTKTLNDKTVKEFEQIEGVVAAMPQTRAFLKFASGRNIAHIDLVGVDTSKMQFFDFEVSKGRLLNEDDKGAIVFGKDVPYQFYDPRSIGRNGIIMYVDNNGEPPPVNVMEDKMIMTFDMSYGESFGNQPGSVRKKTYKVQGVGILEDSGEHNYSAFINMNYLKKLVKDNEREDKRLEGSQSSEYGSYIVYDKGGMMGRSSSQDSYERVLVRVKDVNKVEEVQKKIQEMGFGAYSLADARNQAKKQFAIIQAVLGAIGAISLFVASLGITNTMYMSIYERTREIGIIKVLGCYLRDIRGMFLVEAGMIGFFGGTVGIGISYGISATINTIARRFISDVPDASISRIPLWLALAAVTIAVLVGLIAGYFPSRRAMKLSALDAIKNE
jgi:putative ABC transport system permease protein